MARVVARRPLSLLLGAALVAALVVAVPTAPVAATPVATHDALYSAYGRVFPDPHGCLQGAPTKSPNANGNVCAAQFVQWDEAMEGLAYLEELYPRYVQVVNLQEQFGDHREFTGESFRSAGLPREDLSRDRKDLYVIRVTDGRSETPEADRRHFVYSLSIHGIERAGLEGGIRAVEDLATWAACENGDAPPTVDCDAEASTPESPRRLLDPFDEEGRSPTAGEALADGVMLFTLSNPDGWSRGDYRQGGVFYQRYNGNGMDLNRDWPTVGYSDAAYESWSEPETRGFGRWLKWVADERTRDGKFAGGIDLHGMVTANSLSYTLLGAGQKDYRKNAITVDTASLMWRDAEERLTWSPHVARAEDCPGPVPEPFFGQGRTTAPMCTVQWGTVWDTIEYQITGGMGDWIEHPEIGLGGVGINNEMALSHLAPNNVFEPDIVQLQIEGNKSLIYSQITGLLHEDRITYEPGGRIAYVEDPTRVSSDGEEFVVEPHVYDLPTQRDIRGTEVTGAQGFEFEVEGVPHGYFNQGMTVQATFANVRGIGAGAGTGIVSVDLVLDYCGPAPGEEMHLTHQHAHELVHLGAAADGTGTAAADGTRTSAAEECTEVGRYFNQSPVYSQAGAQIELNRPQPGIYRIRANEARLGPTEYHVRFTRDDAIPGWSDQAPYDVSRTDFFRELNRFVGDGGHELTGVSVEDILADPGVLRTFDSVVIADRFLPPRADGGDRTADDTAAYTEALAAFAGNGGNLVLTDGAVAGLPDLGTGIDAEAVRRGVYYAGYIDFNDGEEPTFDEHPLTRDIQRDGTASGRQTLDGEQYYDRRQTYEPVPMGFLVGGPSTCTSGCDAPIWVVDEAAWQEAGGLHLGRSFVRPGPEGGDGWDGVSLGELPVGDGVVRIVGALLPEPTQDNFHPYGLSSFGLTYTGYQLFENATTWDNPGRQEPGGDDPDAAGREIALTCEDCRITVPAGRTGEARLTVHNHGDGNETVRTSADAPDGWDTRVEPAEVVLEPGASAELILEVAPPQDERGRHTVVATAATADGAASDPTSVAVTVNRSSAPRGPNAGDEGVRAVLSAAGGAGPTGLGGLGLLAVLLLVAAAVRPSRRRT